MWVYDNVRAGSSVLDLGSGAGLLSLLKRKQVRLTGIDLSPACASATLRNGYDLACVAELNDLPFADSSFDYVVSLDVMGHIEFAQKDGVLAEIRRVLKPGGVTLHGIEIMNTERRKDYDQMTEEELKRFVAIDGHVGMESELATKERFSRYFTEVQAEPRFSICQSAEELVKQADDYGVSLCERDLLDYLRHLSHNERRAFNMAMGYLFQQISDHGLQLPDSEYLFLKAANVKIAGLYNEHLDRSALLATNVADEGTTDLNQTTFAVYDGGWYAAEDFPPIGRWMGRRGRVTFRAPAAAKLSLTLVTHLPDVSEHPMHVELSVNGKSQSTLTLADNEPRQIELSLTKMDHNRDSETQELEITADRTWQPSSGYAGSRDDREISIAVYDLKLFF
jgi:SAM-dependent methyltransferase